MALAQAPPIPAEPHDTGHNARSRRRHRSGPSPPVNVPAAAPLELTPHAYQERRVRRGKSLPGSESPQERFVHNRSPPTSGRGRERWDYVDDWNGQRMAPASPTRYQDEMNESLNGNVGGPPPRLIPVSGKLEKNMEKSVLRPTAFKPVVPKSRGAMQYLSPRHSANAPEIQNAHRELSPSGSERRSSYSAGRSGGGSSGHSCSLSDSGRNSLSSLAAGDTVAGGHSEAPKSAPSAGVYGHSDSGRSSSSKSTGSGSVSGRSQPLSDCGSGGRSPGMADSYEGVVRDLEDKLREREAELQLLRDNLDDNEAAICQAYEEKHKRFELELEELRQGCATRMQATSHKAQRAQQVLQMQVHQLQQEKKKLQEDFAHLLKEREQLEERCTSYEHDKIQMAPRLEETKWEVCQKSGEISLLKQQLKEAQVELAGRVSEAGSLRGQLRDARAELSNAQALLQEAGVTARARAAELDVCENELQRRKSEAELLREKSARLEDELARLREPDGERDALRELVERIRGELALERQRAERQVGGFEEERRTWQEEKDKVLRYQQQLQENYVTMYRRNRQLELLLRDLSQELENRDDDDGSGNEIVFDEVAATEI
ncbi:leucine zipper putative tumor suppressor 2 homolog isoform X1 [Syngnathus acus]|uniref:leucine zipper putative tumor suppressor 2 homolog isoform X1 n=2 Tax=Syngnathus acus TaxID=161584 RepID=UPI001885DE76|nr:leucine zipper putative tumor suppressor 2 homolog isoform X1 [Syngnathus acus]XP_037133598.1 leucine zipper putative tumor suppressor 2 homolog isoform X1 [Syngnathus acus]XP_037133599.1 leucine zipper putative tumor suppressor 2 homolog isoform X1 [Syngnathus acus]XP_037133600.1 leucine zipper putative tumor suppressor 2 homolog isoform X1 [Syngnathus acus]XP_037133601.1 leucine zipper putative tumor suppressor 2 homolog isoform X1 [Syngnathus acus]